MSGDAKKSFASDAAPSSAAASAPVSLSAAASTHVGVSASASRSAPTPTHPQPHAPAHAGAYNTGNAHNAPKLAILSESPADEAAVAVLVEAVLGRPFIRVQPALRARGWPSVAQVLPSIIRHLHFNTDADGLVVVVDSDDSVVHTAAHDAPDYYHPLCRICQLRAIFRQTAKKFPPARGRSRVLRGVGVAVPAIEAWYLCGRDDGVTETRWIDGQSAGQPPYTRRELKLRTYGTERPNLQLETEIALEEARRHARDLRRLEHDFPGFAALANDLKSWPLI